MAALPLVTLSSLLDDAKCFDLIRKHRWPEGVRCPHCGNAAMVARDEAPAWNDLHAWFAAKRVVHEHEYRGEDSACTNQAESFFSRARRAEVGQYHHITGPYLRRYAQEVAFRENHHRRPNGGRSTGWSAPPRACGPVPTSAAIGSGHCIDKLCQTHHVSNHNRGVGAMATMNVSLPPDMIDFVNNEVATGDYTSSSEVVREALRLLKHDKALEQEKLAILRREINIGLADAAAGRFSTRTAWEIAEEVKREHFGK